MSANPVGAGGDEKMFSHEADEEMTFRGGNEEFAGKEGENHQHMMSHGIKPLKGNLLGIQQSEYGGAQRGQS